MRRRPDARTGFTLVELMMVVAIIGILTAIALPALSRYIKRSRTGEAITHVARLWSGSLTYYETDHALTGGALPKQFPGPTGGTEIDTECGCRPSGKCDGAWSGWGADPVWAGLVFSLPDAHSYMPRYTGSGVGVNARFTAQLVGDLDCDGTVAVFQRTGLIRAGDVSGASAPQISEELE